MAEELARALAPSEFQRPRPRRLARNGERREAGRAQVLAQHAGAAVADDVEGPGAGKAATGRPLASASSSTMPNVSVSEGNTKTSALA